ncbi:thioesterase [Enterococcus asini]|uniref:acyl-[acyl-carrier-protein] thioesterase n=1 Tax=Enterococcus TaxID=1350 RepID=UPI002890F4B7|nr:acyl-ACP thioesterase domain-containing protein [Enterococcus asini]MDT2756263.1 thioesterase [Enterococcus asini]
MGKKYSEEHKVAYYECDVTGQMTQPAMLAVAIEISEAQSAALGRDSAFVQSLGVTWIITNYQITYNRLPKALEKITVSTMAMEYNKFFCYRNFWLTDELGNELVKIEAVFALMSLETRKMAAVAEEIIAPYGSEKVKKIRRYPKLTKVEGDSYQPYRVRFYDIDNNHHVNNAVYFTWIFDVLGYDFLASHTPKSTAIRFEKEVEYGNQVESHYQIVTREDGAIETRHEIRCGDVVSCEANIVWEAN